MKRVPVRAFSVPNTLVGPVTQSTLPLFALGHAAVSKLGLGIRFCDETEIEQNKKARMLFTVINLEGGLILKSISKDIIKTESICGILPELK
jgi:hypothetical protein